MLIKTANKPRVKISPNSRQKVLLPEGPAKRRENKEALKEMFVKRLDKAITENNHRKQPYYITYKIKFDRERPIYARDLMIVSEICPEVIAGTVIYRIDNQAGTKDLVRVVDP